VNIVLAVATSAVCFSALCVSAPAADSPAAADSSPAATPAAVVVHIKDFRYAPDPVHVQTGRRVTFVNDDDEAHTVTAVDKSFDSAGLDSNASWHHVFSKAGTYTYFCELHPYMKATIVVTTATPGAAR
jgi:plastocyanin